ncbi:hypothetical protein JCM5353_006198 [Sporobolomyces roseus]
MASRSSTPKLNTSKQSSQSSRPTPSPSPAPTSTSSPLPDLSTLLNLPLQLTLKSDPPSSPSRTLKGSLFTYDPSCGFAVLCSSPSSNPSFSSPTSYHLIKTSQILSLSVLSSTPTPSLPLPSQPLPSGPPSTPQAIQQRVSQAVSTLQKQQASRGPKGTSQEVQGVYDSLSKTLPCRWSGQDIVVMDEVVVDTKTWGVKGGKGSKDRIERVQKNIEGIRARLNGNGGAASPALA